LVDDPYVVDFLGLWKLEDRFVKDLSLGKYFVTAVGVGWDQIGEAFARGGRRSGEREV
jgi:hypothetical protein